MKTENWIFSPSIVHDNPLSIIIFNNFFIEFISVFLPPLCFLLLHSICFFHTHLNCSRVKWEGKTQWGKSNKLWFFNLHFLVYSSLLLLSYVFYENIKSVIGFKVNIKNGFQWTLKAAIREFFMLNGNCFNFFLILMRVLRNFK